MSRFLLSMVLVFALVGCSDASDVTRAEDVEKVLNDTLKVGATKDEVEETLRGLSIEHSFDKYASRYQGIIRNAGGPMDHAVVVHVYMDENGKLTTIKARDSYTGP